ncbi:MAG: leucine-rich repeat domain-containing protein [Muribaculum sp.]|nr:leucine-rich repeat domain-containing protein [Muribaculum sp.]
MRIIATLFALLSIIHTYGLDITVGTGQSLLDALSAADASETTLIVHGTVDATDMAAIRDRLPALTYLDMSDATVVPAIIPDYTFAATKIEQFLPPRNLTGIAEGAFAATPLRSFAVAGGLTDIGPHAFAHCQTLTTASLGDNISNIDKYAFSDCTAMTSVVVGRNLHSIGECAFQLSGLESLDLSHCDRLVAIGDRAFTQSPKLKHVTLPDHTFSIGRGAFSFNPYLISVDGLEGAETLPELFAAGCSRYIPDLTHAGSLYDPGLRTSRRQDPDDYFPPCHS